MSEQVRTRGDVVGRVDPAGGRRVHAHDASPTSERTMNQAANELTIRAAQPGDAAGLREILARAKGHWGYERELLRAWVDAYDFEQLFRSHQVIAAEVAGTLIAWASLIPPANGIAVL